MYEATAPFYSLFGFASAELQKRTAFVNSLLKNSFSSIIDVGAATGENAFSLAEEGHSVFCFEPSQAMYAIFLDRLNRRRDLHPLITGFPLKVEDLENCLQADLAFASNVFSHLDITSKKRLLSGIYRQLKPQGLLVLNCAKPCQSRTDQKPEKIAEKKIGNLTYTHWASSKQIDAHQIRIQFRFEIACENKTIKTYEETFILYLDSRKTIEGLLKAQGFHILDVYNNYEGIPFEEKSSGFVVVASS